MNPGQSEDDTVTSVFHVLAHPLRRNLLHSFQKTDETTIEMLARDLVDTGEAQADGCEPREEIIEIKVALHHHHLPKMADTDVIDYDPDAGTITTNDATDVAYDLLKTMESSSYRNW